MVDQLTVRRLLEERLLRGALVLGGDEDRDLNWVHSLHDLDGTPSDLAGVGVVATEVELTEAVVHGLLQAKVAALFVRSADPARWKKLQGRTDPLPLIIAVPSEVGIRSITEMTSRLALSLETHVMRYTQAVHTALAQQLHSGAGVDALSSRLARLSGCGVALFSSDLRVFSFAEERERWLTPTAVAVALRPVLTADSTAHAGLGQHSSAEVTSVEIAGRPATVLWAPIVPIEKAEHGDGWVVLIAPTGSPHPHDIAEQRIAVEQGATIIGTELLRMRSMERVRERARGNFAHALLHNRFSNRSDLISRASYHGFSLQHAYAVVVARSEGLIADGTSPTRLAEMAREAVRIMSVAQETPTLAAVVGDVLSVIVPTDDHLPKHQRAPMGMKTYARALEKRLTQVSGRPVTVAYGRSRVGAELIMESHREARLALALRERLQLPEPCSFDELRVDSLLLDLAQVATGQSFANDILEPLRAEGASDLLDVTRAYTEAGGNLNEAARQLNIHRNTMLYKLNRISRLIGRNVREPETQYMTWLALRISDLAEVTDRVEAELEAG